MLEIILRQRLPHKEYKACNLCFVVSIQIHAHEKCFPVFLQRKSLSRFLLLQLFFMFNCEIELDITTAGM